MPLPPPSPKQARLIWSAASGLAIAVIIGLVAGFIWGMGRVLGILAPVIWPLAIAAVLACLLDPLVGFLERKGLPRQRSILCVFSLALVIILGLFGSVVPQLVVETQQLFSRIPGYANTVEKWVRNPPVPLRKLLGEESQTSPVETNQTSVVTTTNAVAAAPSTNTVPDSPPSTSSHPGLSLDKETLQSATKWLTVALPRVGSWLFGQVGRVAAWFGMLAGLMLVPIYAFYILLEKKGIEAHWTEYLPVSSDYEFKKEIVFVLNSINNYLIAFFRGQVLVAICDGILYTIGFLIVGVPYAILLGAVAIALTLIPFLGAIITCVAALLLTLVQYGDLWHPVGVLAVFAVVQTLEGLVISPKIMGDRVGLHPMTIIISVMVGTTLLGGLLGGILAIPLTAVLRVIMGRYIWKRREALAGNTVFFSKPPENG